MGLKRLNPGFHKKKQRRYYFFYRKRHPQYQTVIYQIIRKITEIFCSDHVKTAGKVPCQPYVINGCFILHKKTVSLVPHLPGFINNTACMGLTKNKISSGLNYPEYFCNNRFYMRVNMMKPAKKKNQVEIIVRKWRF